MNELLFQQYLSRHFPFSQGRGIGDDTSVVCQKNTHQLISTDLLIENIHFRLKDLDMKKLALKSLAVNLSDIAAMGGIPQYFYLGLGFPSKLGWEKAELFFKGLKSGCRKWHLELAGGDFSRSSQLFISITMVGTARHPVFRHNAQCGDLIAITGYTGAAALGLKLLLNGKILEPWTSRYKRVRPRLEEGQVLAKYASAMIDVSDGLIIDVKRILSASGKGGHLYYEKLYIPPSMKKVCRDFHFDEKELVLSGGEDYVLVFTISQEKELQLKKENIRYRLIGQVHSEDNQLIVTHHGEAVHIKKDGYDHFQ